MDIKEYKQKLQELHDEYFGKNIGGGGESSSSKITKLKIKSTSGDTMVKVLDGDGYKLYNWCKRCGFGRGPNSIPDDSKFAYKYLANQQLLENNTEDKITTYFLFEGWSWALLFSNDTVSTGVTSKNNTWMYYCYNWTFVVYRPYPCYRPSFSFNEI